MPFRSVLITLRMIDQTNSSIEEDTKRLYEYHFKIFSTEDNIERSNLMMKPEDSFCCF